MNNGNAFIGLLFVGALGWQYPVAAAIIGGLIVLEAMLLLGARMVRGRIARRQPFQYLPPQEQALRHGSHGFALMVFALLGVAALFWFYGLPGVGR